MRWTTAEDDVLHQALQHDSQKKWKQAAEQINRIVHNGIEKRSAVACSHRFKQLQNKLQRTCVNCHIRTVTGDYTRCEKCLKKLTVKAKEWRQVRHSMEQRTCHRHGCNEPVVVREVCAKHDKHEA